MRVGMRLIKHPPSPGDKIALGRNLDELLR